MFDLVQKHKRLLQVMLGLITVPFAFFGLEAYTRSNRSADDVASVDGAAISQREYSDELRQQQDRMRRLLGPGVDPSAFDTPEARKGMLDAMIDQRLVGMEALRARLIVTKERLDGAIGNIQAFQKDGRFDAETAKTLLRAQGLSEEAFVERIRHEIRMEQVSRSIAGGAIQSREVVRRLAALEEQTRDISEAKIPLQAFLAQVKLDEAALRKHYDEHLADFVAPEGIKAEYVVLSADQLGTQEPPTEAELKAAYDARVVQYRQGEQRRASHILIQAGADASDADRKAARAKAEEILAEVRKSPVRFAELARKLSQDTGSAERGGDLGLFGRGMLVKPFEEAAFKLAENQISGVVESEFGFHIIRLTEIQAGKTRSLDEVRAELSADLIRQKGVRRFAEVAEAFSNLVYEQSDSLQPAAEKYKLKVFTTDWIGRTPAQAKGVLANPKLLGALFSPDSIKTRRNADAIEVAPNILVAARVLEHRPAAQRKFEEVRAEIEALLLKREGAKLAKAEGDAKHAKLQKGEDAGIKWGPVLSVSRRTPGGLDAKTLRSILAVDPSKLPAYVGVMKGEEGYVLYRVVKATDAPLEGPAVKAAAERQSRAAGAQQYEAYVSSLRSRAKININTENMEKK